MSNPNRRGYMNKHGQVLLREPRESAVGEGTATCELGCSKCGQIHTCNKVDLFDRKCPKCEK
jgi:hypothetical protein